MKVLADEKLTNEQTDAFATKETVEAGFSDEDQVKKEVDSEETESTNIANSDISLEEQCALLQNEVNELQKQLEEKENRYLRLQADFENYRRRARLDAEANEKYRAQSLITDLLPVIDNFERALQTKTENEEVKSVLSGMEMVYKSLLAALKAEGAEPIEAVEKEFDPHFHQAVMLVNDESFASNIVVEEMQRGYILKDRVLRPSMVKVNE